MAVKGNPPEIVGAGEYGATTVHLTKDGGTLRLAFGRNGPDKPVYFGAVLLTAEAAQELRNQLTELAG